MVKVKGPLFSLSASGVYEDTLEFRTGEGKTTVHGRRRKPAERSPAQQAQSERFRNAVLAWRELDGETAAAWAAAAVGTSLNGYQLFISEYQTQAIEPPGLPAIP